MLDIQYIRRHPDRVQKAARDKGISIDVQDLLEVDERRRQLLGQIEELRAQRNQKSKRTPTLQGEEKQLNIAEVRQLNERIKGLEDELDTVKNRYEDLMLRVPAVPFDDVPVGESDHDNVELRREGEVPTFSFPIRDHVTLGEMHDLIDIPRGVKIAGSRMYFLKNEAALLHRAVIQLAVDHLVAKGFTPMIVPVMVRDRAMFGTGYFPLGKEQTYVIPEDELNLVGTAEVPLVSYYADEVLSEEELPKRMLGISNCFRREVGSAGKDTRGLYRVHQFTKVEQVVITRADGDEAMRLHWELLHNAEQLLRLLELPYRVVEVCTGDMGQGQVKKHDIETWMPSRNAYSETHSCSSFLDFQARRSGLRYRDGDGQLHYCYTLNNTAIASPRILIPLLEVHQQEDGSIHIPAALRPYLGGREWLRPKREVQE
ncbi:serine--tRNA ligase [Kyrpidia spormannii]|uniref:Serine--tRNA ligase n=1 Tax=Kyrpidia spormannii TaxID=2055160 RepID=A0A2K8N455_9BACL|nr:MULTISPECIES: serine--tRNA ligase [Kyrpidia]ATY84208.1 serine--tRNA ligase [Kyrpidia spormannii]MCL6576065.1 serine--tRNA ligase [Kyrpidia sp.]